MLQVSISKEREAGSIASEWFSEGEIAVSVLLVARSLAGHDFLSKLSLSPIKDTQTKQNKRQKLPRDHQQQPNPTATRASQSSRTHAKGKASRKGFCKKAPSERSKGAATGGSGKRSQAAAKAGRSRVRVDGRSREKTKKITGKGRWKSKVRM